MSDKQIKSNLSEDLKTIVHHKLPADFDLSMIGRIDLHEAEIIANEEIVFLTEEDLIDGLEDFELIPVKFAQKDVKVEKIISTEKVIPVSDGIDVKMEDISFSEEVLFEDFNEQHGVSAGDIIEPEEPEKISAEQDDIHLQQPPVPLSDASEVRTEETEAQFTDISDDIIITEETGVIELDLDDELFGEESHDISSHESDILKQRIDEIHFNHQLGDIIKPEFDEDEYEFIPGSYDDPSIGLNIHLIDDSHVEKKVKDLAAAYISDPLTENLVRMVNVSEGALIILDDTAEVHERIEYMLDNRKAYDSESLALLFREERHMDDSDFDFIDNAIIRDDYTVYIQEIDDYLKSREVLSGSEVYEILGLLPEEIDFIGEKLFGEYYREFDLDFDLEFISPELSFFNRGYVEKKELNYYINDVFSFIDEERKSIEEDITSESAIIFEEDVSDINRLLGENYSVNEVEIIEKIIPDETEPEILDITDSIIILEDKNEIERIISEFPEKHEDLIKLLSYLDGLLEKLPEDSIRKFAESEYFDLYVKVLKEIGI